MSENNTAPKADRPTYEEALRNIKPDPHCKTCKGKGSYPAGDVPGLRWSELCGCVTDQLDTGEES